MSLVRVRVTLSGESPEIKDTYLVIRCEHVPVTLSVQYRDTRSTRLAQPPVHETTSRYTIKSPPPPHPPTHGRTHARTDVFECAVYVLYSVGSVC